MGTKRNTFQISPFESNLEVSSNLFCMPYDFVFIFIASKHYDNQ